MAKNKSNKAWLNRHLHDPYVALANKHGYRSRAAYKLLELHEELRERAGLMPSRYDWVEAAGLLDDIE